MAEVSGSVDVRENAKFSAPALVSVDHVAYNCKFLGHNIEVFDGIGCTVLSEKEKDGISIRHCQKSKFEDGEITGEKFYVASKGKDNAHGETIKEAIEELLFKTGERDVSEFKNIPLSTKKTPEEWAVIYRICTGACRYGTKSFMKSRKLKKAYTLEEILRETEGAYGSHRFREVVTQA